MARGRRGRATQGTEGVASDLPDRICSAPGCTTRATARSMVCGYHQTTAIGVEGARELRQLTREMERMARITDGKAKGIAVAKFRSRVEQGDFAIVFSQRMQASIEQAAEDAALGMELGALRLEMARALQEVDDPKELSLAVARLANASARTTRANTARKREQRQKS